MSPPPLERRVPAAATLAPHIRELTGLRFLAALIVMVGHFCRLGLPKALDVVEANNMAPVGLFFVLSGFVLAVSYGNRLFAGDGRTTVRSFYRARLARILPVHWLIVTVAVPIMLGVLRYTGDAPSWQTLLGSLLATYGLVHIYVIPSYWFGYFWNAPSWSIATELVFYILFPPFCYLTRHVRGARAWLAILFAMIAIEYLTFFGTSLLFAHHPKHERVMIELVYKLFVYRIWEFLAGCALGALFTRRGIAVLGTRARRDALLAASLAWIAAVATLERRELLPAYAHLFPAYTPAFIAMIAALASGRSFASLWLASTPMVLLGEASFSLYLLHGPIYHALETVYHRGELSQWVILAIMLTCIGLSLACYRWFELPMRDRWRAKPTREATPHPLSEPREAISA